MELNAIHHVAIIVSDYAAAKDFYVNKLGLPVIRENYRPARGTGSWICSWAAASWSCSPSRIRPPAFRGRRPAGCGIWRFPCRTWRRPRPPCAQRASRRSPSVWTNTPAGA
jgi:catechol 2,3-dioxygenase-like lactoylglutathione lyase family enzyme